MLKDSDFWLKINILWNHKIYTTVAQLVVINFHFKNYFLLEFSSNNKTWNVKFIWCVKVQNRNCFDVFKTSFGYSASSIKRQICLVCNSTKKKLSTFLRNLLEIEIQKVKWNVKFIWHVIVQTRIYRSTCLLKLLVIHEVLKLSYSKAEHTWL